MKTLKETRMERGITAEAALRAIGVSRPTYMKYEDDPSLIPYGKYLQLCDLLDVEPGDIFLPQAINQIHRKEANHGAVANQ